MLETMIQNPTYIQAETVERGPVEHANQDITIEDMKKFFSSSRYRAQLLRILYLHIHSQGVSWEKACELLYPVAVKHHYDEGVHGTIQNWMKFVFAEFVLQNELGRTCLRVAPSDTFLCLMIPELLQNRFLNEAQAEQLRRRQKALQKG